MDPTFSGKIANTESSKKRIGIVINKYESWYYGKLLDGMVQQLEARGYTTQIISTALSKMTECDAWASLIQSGCKGVIIHSNTASDKQLNEMIQHHPEAVFVNRYLEDYPNQCVCQNNVEGGRLAVKHLIEMGHRRIAMITGPSTYRDVSDRSYGFKIELKNNDLPVLNDLIVEGDFLSNSGARCLEYVLQSALSFTAVFVHNDIMASGVLRACEKEKISVPHDISIVGFDNSPITGITNPKLTSIRYPLSEIGSRAVKALHNILTNNTAPNCDADSAGEILPELIVRESVQISPSSKRGKERRLTQRERECIHWTANGKTSGEIAIILDISEYTVTFHLQNAISKLGASNRAHAVALALSQRYITMKTATVS